MCITLLDNLEAVSAEDDHSVLSWLQHLEGQEVPDLEVMTHRKCWPAVVNGCRPIMFDDGHPPVAAGVRLKDELFREVAKMMPESWRNGQQVQARCPDYLAEVRWTHLFVEVPDEGPPSLGGTAAYYLLALR